MRIRAIEDFMKLAGKMTDDDIWLLAILQVCLAGGRARRAKRATLEKACIDFVGVFCDELDYPPPPGILRPQ